MGSTENEDLQDNFGLKQVSLIANEARSKWGSSRHLPTDRLAKFLAKKAAGGFFLRWKFLSQIFFLSIWKIFWLLFLMKSEIVVTEKSWLMGTGSDLLIELDKTWIFRKLSLVWLLSAAIGQRFLDLPLLLLFLLCCCSCCVVVLVVVFVLVLVYLLGHFLI